MKKFYPVLLLSMPLITGTLQAQAAEMMTVTLDGSFHATLERQIATGPEGSALIYSVLGASVIRDGSGNSYPVSIECLGIDLLGGSEETSGRGYCLWRDADDEHLYVKVETSGEKNRYRVTGGSGKWSGAAGEISSGFAYLPAPTAEEFLGAEKGSGKLSKPTPTGK